MAAKLPQVLPGGTMLPAVRWQDFSKIAIKSWQDAGGESRLTDIMSKDDEHFMEVSKIMLKKTLPSLSVSATTSIEDILERADKGEVIEGEIVDGVLVVESAEK